jgi:hypothetical protein
MKELNELAKNVHDRLEYIEFMLRFRGWFSRADLTERFRLGEAAATRDIRLYKDYSEDNMTLEPSTKRYVLNESSFSPLFDMRAQTALSKLRTSKICEALGMAESDGVLCPPRLTLPDVSVISNITRAISSGSTLITAYWSIKNGASDKILSPHALFDNGVHWYMRAFDPRHNEFRSYALTRIKDAKVAIQNTDMNAVTSKDHQWNRMVNLELVPHPNRKNVASPETVEHDFSMDNGFFSVSVRAVVAGYWLHHWSVDCTEDHSLEGYEYQLWLKNHNTLYDVDSRKIAPGLSDYNNNV